MKNYYIKSIKRAKFARFADKFAIFAAVFGLAVCFFAWGYELGQAHGLRTGLFSGVESLQECERNGASGYAIDSKYGVECIYD